LRLEIGNIYIKDVQFGEKTEVKEGILFVIKRNWPKLPVMMSASNRWKYYLAKPGEETRIIP
jgi:hypothetical protein